MKGSFWRVSGLAVGLIVVVVTMARTAEGSVISVSPEEVCSIRQAYPDSTASWTNMGYFPGGGDHMIGYCKFILPNQPGQDIESALFTVGGITGSTSPAGYRVYANWVSDDSWSASTMTWNNAPVNSPTTIVDTGAYQLTNASYQVVGPIDITSLLTANEGTKLLGQTVTLAMYITSPTGAIGEAYWGGYAVSSGYLEIQSVPEPVTLSILTVGGMILVRNKRR